MHRFRLTLALTLSLTALPAVAASDPPVVPPETAAASDAAPAPAVVPSADQIMYWQFYQLGGASAGKQDMAIYFSKQHWITKDLGVYAMYNTGQAATVRATGKLALPWDFTAVGMAGLRLVALGSSPVTLSPTIHEGPEASLALNHALIGKLNGSLWGSYGRLFALNPDEAAGPATTEGINLWFYGVTVSYPIAPSTSLTAGFQGSVQTGDVRGLHFHNSGPSLALSHTY